MEFQLSNENNLINSANCSNDKTLFKSNTHNSWMKAGTNSTTMLENRSPEKKVAVDSGTFCTKTVQEMFQDGTSSTKTDGNLQGGTSSTKTERKFQDRNLQDGTSSTKTEQKFQGRNLQGGTSSTKTEQKFQDRNLQDGTSSTKTEQKFQDRNLQDGTSSTKTEQKFQDRNLQGGTSSTETERKFQDRNLQGGTSSTKTVPKFQHGTSSTKTDGNLQDGTSSAKTVPKFQDGTSSTKTDGNLQDGTSSAKTVPKFQDGTSSTKTDGNLQDDTSSAKTNPKFQDGTSSTKTEGNLQDGTSSAKTVPKFQDGTSSTKTGGKLQDGTSSTNKDRNLQDDTSSANTDQKFQDGTSSTKTDGQLPDGTSSTKKDRKLQMGTCGTKSDRDCQNNINGESICVHQVRAGSSFVQLTVGSIDINARIDSGAEITILSSKIYEKLSKAPAKIKEVDLQMADNDTVMKGFIIQPLKMRLGNQCFSERVYVASIGDDMLLGHDLLHHLGVCLDLRTDTLVLNEEVIPISTSFKDKRVTVARVSIGKRVKVPPNSVVRLTCQLNTKMQEDYYIEPMDKLKVFMPRTVCTAESEPIICLINPTDSLKTLKKGAIIGSAYGVISYPEEDIRSEVSSNNRNPKVSLVNQDNNDEDRTGSTEQEYRREQEIPEHLKQLYDSSLENLDAEQQQKLKTLLCNYQDVFAKHDFDLGTVTAIQHTVDTGTAKPIKQRMRRTPVCFANEEEVLLEKMLDAGVIQESVSDWASSPVLIRKRDGSVRWCIDYRALNEVTIKDTFPLPIIEDCLDTLAGNVWFSKLDANSAYWQVLVNPEDRKKTAFLTKYGLFEHVRMGFGMTNSPATFSRVINLILRGLTWKTVLAFLDDILIMGMSFENHLKNLEEAFERFRQYGLKLKPRKCILFQSEVEFLGRMVSKNQLKMGVKDISTITDWPVPTSSKEVERFLGLANYHRSFIKNFAELAQPLYSLTGKNKFKWEDEEQAAFDELKDALTNPPVLGLPNSYDPLILDTDASDMAIGAELIQVQNGEERVIAYSSFALTPEQKRYCTTRKELLSIVRFTRHFRHYLLGTIFTVRTDHSSLTWLLKFKDPQGQIARWMEELSQYNMVVQHRSGAKHGNADALSRRPDTLTPCSSYVAGITPADLPCGGCHYCVRADQQWGNFVRDVDEAVSLTNLSSNEVVSNTGDRQRTEFVQNINSISDPDVMPEMSETKMSGCNQETSCLAPTFHSKQNSQDNLEILEDFSEVNSVGLSDIHFDIFREGKEVIDVYACTIGEAQTATSEQPSCWGFSYDELKTEQEKDKDLNFVIQWLNTKEEPGEGSLFICSPEAKYYWLNKEMFKLVDSVLFRQKTISNDLELVVPDSLKEQALFLHHDIPSAAHQGIARTKAKLKEKFFWVRLSRDVEMYVLSCSVCSKNKKNKRYGKFPLTEYQAGAPMERVHIDFIGPLPKTEQGNEHCLMMVDQFTKWVECIPLSSQKAEITAKAAVDEFFSRFGFPFQLFSDQGRNFESKLFESLCKALEIHKTRTTPYRPSANGQVERFNRTLMDAVRCFLGKAQNKWDQHVQQIAGAMRAAVNRSTGFTPNMLMLGREVNTPAQLMFPNVQEKHEDYGEYVSGLVKTIKSAHDCARNTLKTSLKRMKRNYDLRVLLRPYAEGDIIYLLDTASAKGKSRKLSAPWKGPALIVKKLSAYLYRVKLRNAVFGVNHDRMMPCNDRKVPEWIDKYKKSNSEEEQDEEDDLKQYCICKKPYSGRFMIQCDYCDEWYHGSCVNITVTDALVIDKYRCKACKDNRS